MNLSDWVLSDWQRKVAALVFSVMIWYWVRQEIKQTLVLRNLPVRLVAPEDVAILTEPPRVTVELKASKRRLAALTQRDVEIVALVPDVDERGEVNIQVTPGNVKVPLGVRVSEVRIQDPADMLVGIDKLVTVSLKIRHRFSDSLPAEFAFKRAEAVPKMATVTGPRGTVLNLKEVTTESIEIGPNPPMIFNRQARLMTVPRVRIVPEEVDVQVELYRQSDDREFSKIPVQILAPRDSDMTVTEFAGGAGGGADGPAMVEVVIQGPKATIDSLTDASLRAFVDLSDISTAGTYRKPAQVWVNARNCRVLETIPAIFEIRVARRAQE